MKRLWLGALFFCLSSGAHAETNLQCRNIGSPAGSSPAITAEIRANGELTNIRLTRTDRFWIPYIYSNGTESDGSLLEERSKVENPRGPHAPEDLLGMGSKDLNQYSLEAGTWTTRRVVGREVVYDNEGNYAAEWTLPRDLSNANLSTYKIRGSDQANSFLQMPAPHKSAQDRARTLILFCESN